MREPWEIHAKFLAVPAAHENRQNSRGDFYNFHAWWVKIFSIDDWSTLYCLSLWLKEKTIVCHSDWKKRKKQLWGTIKEISLPLNYLPITPYYVAFKKNWHLRNASQLRSLTSHMIMTPAESICNQFEPRSGPNSHSKFDTLMVFLELT